MNPANPDQNAACLDLELTWFSQILEHRFQLRADGKTEFGGLRGDAHSGFLLTCETAMFLLAASPPTYLGTISSSTHPPAKK